MKALRVFLWCSCCLLPFVGPAGRAAVNQEASASPYARWSRGLSTDSNYFPIAVWLQSPRNAARYRAAGINLYVGLWRGPTASQLDELQGAGMHVICDQNATAKAHLDSPVIVGWMHGDEPDNAQELGRGQGYGPPITPERIIEQYRNIRDTDPTRPVLLNLGQGVAWDNYIGRGVRRNHPEDYPHYVQGCDIASFDIYPVVHDSKEVAGRLEFVGKGVERLVQWSGSERIVWNCVECTHIGNPETKATPQQVRAEVWMALVKGSRGLIYFVHQFKPKFDEAALLNDPAMLDGVTAVNRQIRELAPVLNSGSATNLVQVQCRPGAMASTLASGSSISFLQKRHGGKLWLFAVNMSPDPRIATLTCQHPPRATDSEKNGAVEVLYQNRSIAPNSNQFEDNFEPYAVHLYSWSEPTSGAPGN